MTEEDIFWLNVDFTVAPKYAIVLSNPGETDPIPFISAGQLARGHHWEQEVEVRNIEDPADIDVIFSGEHGDELFASAEPMAFHLGANGVQKVLLKLDITEDADPSILHAVGYGFRKVS